MKDNLSSIENQLLVMAAQGGSAKALEKLVRLWQKKLWRYVFRLTDDSHAAIFVCCLRSIIFSEAK